MAVPEGFTWVRRKNGEVVISHHGRPAATLRGNKADEFVDGTAAGGDDAASGDDQELMARLTGNYRRGNERQSRNHPRNQRR